MKEALFIEVTESKILTMTMLKALLKLNCRAVHSSGTLLHESMSK